MSNKNSRFFHVVVVGGGHAGIEAAVAVAKMGLSAAMVTMDKGHIGNMPCNPSVGGPAKGIVTREIDALGGLQAKAADATALQMKMLNTSKGPGVWALRCQSDKIEYKRHMLKAVENSGVAIIEDEVVDLLVKDCVIKGLVTRKESIAAKAVILTTGTYLRSVTMRGFEKKTEGPDGQKSAGDLSVRLKELGFEMIRLKTGTPPRLMKDSIDYSQLQEEPGTERPLSFSHDPQSPDLVGRQLPCYLLHTNDETHRLIRENLDQCSMHNGLVEGIGARYCPSVEDKVVRFADKPRHQLFVEPESIHLPTVYLGGFSTSMPEQIQDKMIRTLPGMKNAVVAKYSYAIEYDAIVPTQLSLTLETKTISGLYTAGQINGTSGYEEAACQGLMAGINAALKIKGEPPLVLKRSEAYIGVLIDDLTGKGVMDPYRLLTSRAEHRLQLRNDNAQERLAFYGRRVGLVDKKAYALYEQRKAAVLTAEKVLSKKVIFPSSDLGRKAAINNPVFARELLKRPEFLLDDFGEIPEICSLDRQGAEQLAIRIKFEGYIKAQEKQINAIPKSESVVIPRDVDYRLVANISLEARDKLSRLRPDTIGQATRISGINPADITMLLLYIRRNHERSGA